MKGLMLSLALLAMVSVAGANSFTADGTVFEPSHGYDYLGDRYLIPDGDFEQGTCINTPTWICTTTNSCDWIADLVPLGLWNYSGSHIAWFGGFCGGLATCQTTMCKDVAFGDEYYCFISWYWMAYVSDAVMEFWVEVDGDRVFSFFPQLSDHMLDYQYAAAYVDLVPGVHHLCFGMDDSGCAANQGDNYFVDYVELTGITAVAPTNLSTVKALY